MLRLFSVSVLFCLRHHVKKSYFFKHVNEYLHKSPCFTDLIANPCLQCTVSGLSCFFSLTELRLDF